MKRLALSCIPVNETDQQCRASYARMKLLQNGKILWNEPRFEDQILRRISGNREFRCQNQFRAGSRETLISAHDPLKIAAQIPDRRINLSKANLHAAHGRLCATQPAA